MGGGCFVKKSCGLIYFDYSDRVSCQKRPFLMPDNTQKQAQVPVNRKLAKIILRHWLEWEGKETRKMCVTKPTHSVKI